jgi:serine/threonine protein kinase
MQINPVLAILGLGREALTAFLPLLFVLLMIIVPLAIVTFFVMIIIWWAKRKPATKNPPSVAKKLCSNCGGELAADAPQGMCPKCLMKAGFESRSNEPPRNSFSPSREEIAKAFPQLEIIGIIGRGGMGTVYKARQPQLDRLVALKILSADLSREPAFAERFSREAKALARLNHPNIVTVYDFGKSGDFYFLMMELVDGLSLWQMEQAKKPLAPEQALAIVPKICEALQYAHDQGIVHRDIKPANILIDKEGRVKIADFGLAILLKDAPGLGLTQAQSAMGTPHYMAPEQWEKPLSVDHRADIFSLGVVFYEMLTGELPLGRFPPPSRKVQVDVRLDEVVLRALEKEPDLRYQQASQVQLAVETITRPA